MAMAMVVIHSGACMCVGACGRKQMCCAEGGEDSGRRRAGWCENNTSPTNTLYTWCGFMGGYTLRGPTHMLETTTTMMEPALNNKI